jgi:hypothetical protein
MKSKHIDNLPKQDDFSNLIRELSALEDKNRKIKDEKFIQEPPNEHCYHAIVEGVIFGNFAGLKKGDYIPLLTFGYEKLHVWTHTKNQYSVLVAEVDQKIHNLNIWKPFGTCLQLADAFQRQFEAVFPVEYSWIINFIPSNDLESQNYFDRDSVYPSGLALQLRYLLDIASILELLMRDDTFFVALQNFMNSVRNHYFCIICALQRDGYQMHPNHEPAIWEIASSIPSMETAIVQSTRTVEAILGKPGKRSESKKVERAKERWLNNLELSPDDIFELTEKSYFEYYYDLFGIRGNAAHSLGKLPYRLSRELIIEAQCFAWIILVDYFNKCALDITTAADKMSLNVDLIKKEPRGGIT